MDRNFIYLLRIIHEHLPVPFSGTYCRRAFIAWIQEIYFYHCSPKKGLCNEFSLGKSKCHGGILLRKTCFPRRKDVKPQRFFKRHIDLHISSSHTNNKHSFDLIYFRSVLVLVLLRKKEDLQDTDFSFTFKGQVLQKVSNLSEISKVKKPTCPSPVSWLGARSVFGAGQKEQYLADGAEKRR